MTAATADTTQNPNTEAGTTQNPNAEAESTSMDMDSNGEVVM